MLHATHQLISVIFELLYFDVFPQSDRTLRTTDPFMLYAGNRTSTTWVLVFTLNVYDWMVAVDVFMEVSGRFPAVRDNNAGYFTPNQSGLCAQIWLDHKQSIEPKETSSCYIKIVKCPTCLCLQDLLCQHVFPPLGWIMINWEWLFYDFIVFVTVQIKWWPAEILLQKMPQWTEALTLFEES